MFQIILLTLMGANNGGREIAAERTLYENQLALAEERKKNGEADKKAYEAARDATIRSSPPPYISLTP